MMDDQSLSDRWIVKPGETFPPLEEIFTGYVKDFPDLGCKPGAVSQYSNPHYLALARTIEMVSGEPYDTYVVGHVLVPIQMHSTRFEVVEADERYAKGQWPADKTDKLVAKLGGHYEDVQVLQPETGAAMQEMQRSTDGSPLGFGLSWIIGEDEFGKFYGHSGGGHTIETTMRVYPGLDLGVVVMSNFNGSQAEKIASGLVAAWMHEK